MQPEDPSVETQAPYDVLFHVGTIGCVSDPLGITTVSPLAAAVIAFWTSVLEQLAAVVVPPAAGTMEYVHSARVAVANRDIGLMIALRL